MYRQTQLDVFQYVKMWLTLLSPIPSAATNHVSAYTALTTCTACRRLHRLTLHLYCNLGHQWSAPLNQWKCCLISSFDVGKRIDEVVFKPY
jgi:hypothetical protein